MQDEPDAYAQTIREFLGEVEARSVAAELCACC
jgi:hypothetical protein